MLKEDAVIKEKLSGIYLSIQQDAKYPFGLINFTEVRDFSKYLHARYELEFEICLFSRDKSQSKLLSISDHVESILTSEMEFEEFKIVSLRKQKAEWIRGQDILTTKLAIKYKALISNV